MRSRLVTCCPIKLKAGWEGKKLRSLWCCSRQREYITVDLQGSDHNDHTAVLKGWSSIHRKQAGSPASLAFLPFIHPSIHLWNKCQECANSQALWIQPGTRLSWSPQPGDRHLTIITEQGILIFKCNHGTVVIFHKRALIIQRHTPRYLQMKWCDASD